MSSLSVDAPTSDQWSSLALSINEESGHAPPESTTDGTSVTKHASETTNPHDAPNPESPLPKDIYNILREISEIGVCSSLPWHENSAMPLGSVARGSFIHRQEQPPHSIHRRSLNHSIHPKLRNGLSHKQGRKRPLAGLKSGGMHSWGTGLFSPGSLDSSRTSGSEADDLQYECDSEGTSVTTNSEISSERRSQRVNHQTTFRSTKRPAETRVETFAGEPQNDTKTETEQLLKHQKYKCLEEVFRVAISAVLDHYYLQRGGYKLSPVEKHKYTATNPHGIDSESAAEYIYSQRKQSILQALSSSEARNGTIPEDIAAEAPPFTIQRLAEVLIAPDRCYTQTHKLCNCLEKLVLVKASSNAFGGSNGGDTSQSRREESELIALADEKGRLRSEYRHRHNLKRRSSEDNSRSSQSTLIRRNTSHTDDIDDYGKHNKRRKNGSLDGSEDSDSSDGSDTQESLEAAARASLRTKFDHTGIDPHLAAINHRDDLDLSDIREMTKSPPPPHLSMTSSPPGLALSGHGSLLGQHHLQSEHEPHQMGPMSSELMYKQGGEKSPSSMSHGEGQGISRMKLLHLRHTSSLGNETPFQIGGVMKSNGDKSALATSASDSDVDSESDMSFDDSASDRSDSSDSGNYEPFSAARAVALSRLYLSQRQRRYYQSADSARSSPVESDVHAGTPTETNQTDDSGGSDSSLSDLND